MTELISTRYVIQWKGEDFDWEDSIVRSSKTLGDASNIFSLATKKMSQYKWRVLRVSTEIVFCDEDNDLLLDE